MCGILGYLACSKHPELEQSLSALAHRGPDGSGKSEGPVTGGYYWFGHRRLSIIDLEGGAQPFEKHGLVICFNGEIYNYVELADELITKYGVTLRTRSDTEVLLEAYRIWGDRALQRLNGMWAFAILDTSSGEVFCARDRMGKKPFYYVSNASGFFFASEPAPLLAVIPRIEADTTTLVAYLVGGEAAQDRSFFAGISRVPAASSLRVGPGFTPRVERYWSGDGRPELDISLEEACEHIRFLLHDAVALRLRSDVGFAVAASGGLDSTIILATAAAISEKPVRTVSVTFDKEFAWDETRHIENLTQYFPIEPTYARANAEIGIETMLQEADTAVAFLGEPTPYTSVPYVNRLYEATANSGIKVLLEGQGADEMFGGYTYFRALQKFALLRHQTSLYDFLLALRIRSRVGRSLYYHLNTFGPFLAKHAQATIRPHRLTPSIHTALLQAQRDSILPDLLQYSDRLAMRWGVEVRLPFLDYRLVEFANALPDNFKVENVETKRVLRAAFSGIVPESVLERSKVGFGSPTPNLLRQNLSVLIDRFIERGEFANSAIFSNGWRRAVRCGFLRTLPNRERVVWRFMLIDFWMKRFGVEVSP